MTPDGFPPFVSPDDGFDTEAELDRAARSILRNRHRDIPADLFDEMLSQDGSLREEYEDLLKQMRRPVPNRPLPRSGWLAGGVRVFEVTESPEGEPVHFVHDGREYTIRNSYIMNYVPNRPRHSIAPWALSYGQNRRVQ